MVNQEGSRTAGTSEGQAFKEGSGQTRRILQGPSSGSGGRGPPWLPQLHPEMGAQSEQVAF